MTELSALWLPILLGAVFAFIASNIIHMVLPWHKNEYPPLPDEDKARAAIGALNVPPGDYMLPRCKTHEGDGHARIQGEAAPGARTGSSPRCRRAITAWRRMMIMWFVFLLLVALFSAYVASHALAPGAHY